MQLAQTLQCKSKLPNDSLDIYTDTDSQSLGLLGMSTVYFPSAAPPGALGQLRVHISRIQLVPHHMIFSKKEAAKLSYRHLSLLISLSRYGLSYITFNSASRWARVSYRVAFISAAVTYGIVVYKAFRARTRAGAKVQGGYLSLIADENVQYLGMVPLPFPSCDLLKKKDRSLNIYL